MSQRLATCDSQYILLDYLPESKLEEGSVSSTWSCGALPSCAQTSGTPNQSDLQNISSLEALNFQIFSTHTRNLQCLPSGTVTIGKYSNSSTSSDILRIASYALLTAIRTTIIILQHKPLVKLSPTPARAIDTLQLPQLLSPSQNVPRKSRPRVFTSSKRVQSPPRPHLRPLNQPPSKSPPRTPIPRFHILRNARRSQSSSYGRALLIRPRTRHTEEYLNAEVVARLEILE